jgi:hypothetical protein
MAQPYFGDRAFFSMEDNQLKVDGFLDLKNKIK